MTLSADDKSTTAIISEHRLLQCQKRELLFTYGQRSCQNIIPCGMRTRPVKRGKSLELASLLEMTASASKPSRNMYKSQSEKLIKSRCYFNGGTLTFQKFFDILFIENKKGGFTMLEVFRALILVQDFCIQQENCKTCPMKNICGKIPCEW